jgi:hypothetical protein
MPAQCRFFVARQGQITRKFARLTFPAAPAFVLSEPAFRFPRNDFRE